MNKKSKLLIREELRVCNVNVYRWRQVEQGSMPLFSMIAEGEIVSNPVEL